MAKTIKMTVRQTKEIACSYCAISKLLPALKETEIPAYCFSAIAQDFLNGRIGIEIWPELLRLDFGDKTKDLEYAQTKGITLDADTFDIVVTGRKDGKVDCENTWAYLKQEGISRAPTAHILKLVMFYTRRKLENECKQGAGKAVVSGTIDVSQAFGDLIALLERQLNDATQTLNEIKTMLAKKED